MSKQGHPKGLYILFFTEMWERFSFYLMLGILTLYMIDKPGGGPFDGLGFSKAGAASVYGSYIALVYFTPFLGGLLADRWLGYRRAIVIGGLFMATGHILLAFAGTSSAGQAFFYSALTCLICGNGFFKPNISTMVGNLYEADDPRRDSGFNIFYMGINIGAFFCNFIAAYLRNKYGWHYAFASAGIGMGVGLLIFLMNYKKLAAADQSSGAADHADSAGGVGQIVLKAFLPALVIGGIGYWLVGPTGGFLLATVPVIAFYLNIWWHLQGKERRRVGALLTVFGVVIIFWMIFHQNGAALTFWAEENTDRQPNVVTGWVMQTFHMDQKVKRGDRYFKNAKEVQWKAGQKKMSLVSAELFQSINPFFVIVLTPLLVGVWALLKRRKREPSTPAKIGLGMLLTGASTLIMIVAVLVTHDGASKASPWWLIGTYGVITIGELCLSPMGLSLVTKLAPARLAGLMMGGWFVSTAFGNKLSGVLGSWWEKISHLTFFLMLFGAAIAAAAVVFVLLPSLREAMKVSSSKEE
jgi:proton-dependent oligopeptide transporter, POT family